MQIKFIQEGGVGYFPGLSKPVTIEVDSLEKGQAEELKRLVDSAHFFDLPADVGTPLPPGAADYQHYTIIIEEGGRRHSVRIPVPMKDEAMQKLVRAVQMQVKAARAAEIRTPAKPTGGKQNP
jgi:hypothetical protein